MNLRFVDDIWQTGACVMCNDTAESNRICSIDQDTHVPRSGRDLIRQTLEDANIKVSVIFNSSVSGAVSDLHLSVPRGSSSTCLHP